MTDDRMSKPTDAERVQLTDLIKENTETLKLGFQEGFDLMAHRDGTQDADEIAGLDHLIAVDPTTGVVGGIDASAKTFWRNHVSLDITIANLLNEMEDAWRECIRYGGEVPNFILAGETFIDAYRAATNTVVGREVQVTAERNRGVNLDGSVGSGVSTGLYFKGVEIIWDPVFDVLDTADSPTQEWSSRCYFINTKYIKLRPIKGHWMVARKPPRVYDRYTHYWATTAKAAMTIGKRRAHALLTATGS